MCPRCRKRPAVEDPTLGFIPCDKCQGKDIPLSEKTRFYIRAQGDRVRKELDEHSADVEQPYIGNKVNPKYFKIYPSQIEQYGIREQLKEAE